VNSVKLDYPVYIDGLHTTIPIKHALDIATGTGEVAILLGQKAKEMKLNLTIIGLDPSAEMLNIAEDKTNKASLKDVITYRHDDVLNLASIFPENMFQIVTVSFGIRNVQNYTQALIEIRRVLFLTYLLISTLLLIPTLSLIPTHLFIRFYPHLVVSISWSSPLLRPAPGCRPSSTSSCITFYH